MHALNIVGVVFSVIAAALFYAFLIYIIIRKNRKSFVNISLPATSYGQYMGRDDRGFTECINVQTRSKPSHIFFDADSWLSKDVNLDHAVNWIVKSILRLKDESRRDGDQIEGLAFVEKDSGPCGLISLQYLLAEKTGMKTCSVKLRRWPFLPQAAIKGEPPSRGSKWIVISDVATTGGHILKVKKIFEHPCWEAKICSAIVLLNRSGDVVLRDLKNVGIKLISNPLIDQEFVEKSTKQQSGDSDLALIGEAIRSGF